LCPKDEENGDDELKHCRNGSIYIDPSG